MTKLAPEVLLDTLSSPLIKPLSLITSCQTIFTMKLIRYSISQAATRNSRFSTLTDSHLDTFRSFLSPPEIITQSLEDYNYDYYRTHSGHSRLVLQPLSTQSVSKILKFCNDNMLAVVPQGGNTGLVGGSVPIFDEIVVSTRKLNKIENFSEVSSVLSCQAGCVLENLNTHLGGFGYEVPLDLGAKGSCQIGGNLSTHAGGKFFIKYGPLRANVLGMEAVLADGTVLNMRSTIRKDNTGIDLKQLFIGSEGTLGMITAVDINCVKVDSDRQVLLIKTKDFGKILEAVQTTKRVLGKNLNAIEFFDYDCYHMMTQYYPSVISAEKGDNFLLIETSEAKIEELFSSLPAFDDAIMSSNQKQYLSIWKIREDIAEICKRVGKKHLIFDISFDITKWGKFLQNQKSRVGDKGKLLGYGHIGDGNLHLNVMLYDEKDNYDEVAMFKEVVREKGSISAEHGVGTQKVNLLHLQKPKEVLQLCDQIKNTFDPKGILNPYKLYA